MYMFINFGVSSILVFALGFVGDWIGLERTYQICVIVALGTIPMAFLLTRFTHTADDE